MDLLCPLQGTANLTSVRTDFQCYGKFFLDELIKTALGLVVRRLRTERKFSQARLGQLSNLQRKHISAIENGEKQPSITTVFQLAQALSVRPGNLVTMIDIEYQKLVADKED